MNSGGSPKPRERSLQTAAGVAVVWQDVTVRAGSGWWRPATLILRGASGCIPSGKLTALLGPSGAGKTTLIDALAGRTPAQRVQGRVLYCGRSLNSDLRRRLLSYVEQQDALVPNLTVLEMLAYTCELRSPAGTPGAAVSERAEEVASELGLQSCRHILIGDQRRRGVSGGQRRRTSIGVALVSSPAVLLLDEPTSGLDSRAALEVVDVLRQQADRGMTVLASVHQPSERLLSRFDVIILAAAGRMVYQGPSGQAAHDFLAQQLPVTAAELGSLLPLPDWLLDCLEQADRSGELAKLQPHIDSCLLTASNLAGSCESSKGCFDSQAELSVVQRAGLPGRGPRKGTLRCCWVLVKYRMRADYRSPVFVLPRIVDKLGLAFLMGTLYLGVGGSKDMRATCNTLNLLSMWVILSGFSAIGFISALMLETQLFVRERHTGLYPILSYLLAKMVGEMALVLGVSVVLAVFVWFLAELSGSFLLFWLPYLVSMAIGVAVGYLVSALSPTIDVCILALAGYVISLIFFAGLVMNWSTVPGYWKWYATISYMRYAWGATMINQFSADPRQLGNESVLHDFSLDGTSAWGMLGVQCAFFFAFLLLAWAALWARESLPRWDPALPACLRRHATGGGRCKRDVEDGREQAAGSARAPTAAVPI